MSLFSSQSVMNVSSLSLSRSVMSDCSRPVSSVHGIIPGKNTGVGAISFSRGFPNLGMEHTSLVPLALAGRFFTTSTTREAQYKYII